MKVLIIEDEPLAAKRLQSLLTELDPNIQVVGVTDSIVESVGWLGQNILPDLIFMDIMLADGQSFEIFEKVNITAPVIFITAYDKFAIEAFKVNSIDYLLKPIEPEMLARALQKFETFANPVKYLTQTIKSLMELNNKNLGAVYQNRFLVKSGAKFIPIPVSDIAYFSFSDKLSFLTTKDNTRLMIDYSLDELETLVDPGMFFRVNRQYITAVTAITLVHNYFNGKLKASVFPVIPEGIIISKEKSQAFKGWLNT